MVACANNIHHMCAAVCFPAGCLTGAHHNTQHCYSITVYTRSRSLQIRGAEDKLAFKEAGYRIVCKQCAPDSRKPYNMQQLGSRLPSDIHHEYTVACAAEQIEEALKTASPSTVYTLQWSRYCSCSGCHAGRHSRIIGPREHLVDQCECSRAWTVAWRKACLGAGHSGE